MSASRDIRDAVAQLLEERLKYDVKVVRKDDSGIDKNFETMIEEALEQFKICVFVLPPLPKRFMQGNPFIFFESAQIRVRVVEFPLLHCADFDGYDVVEAIALALNWINPGQLLGHPMQLAQTPVEMVEDPEKRIFDVIFEFPYQLNPEPENEAED